MISLDEKLKNVVNPPDPYGTIIYSNRIESAHEYLNKEEALKREIGLFKMLQQANDLGLLSVKGEGFELKSDFHFYNNSNVELITPAKFQDKMSKIVEIKEYENLIRYSKIKFDDKIPLSNGNSHFIDTLQKSMQEVEQVTKPQNFKKPSKKYLSRG